MSALAWVIIALIVLAVFIVVFAWFYERATSEVSLVRTGIGGRKVVSSGGTIAIPYFHEIARVNMQTLRLDVQRRGESSLITKDRMRVDVGAEFYVSVASDPQSITRAAQNLGKRTFQADQLRALLDGMMVNALRSVAARMTMDELHENRSTFVGEVRDALKDVLARYGLELDSVSLTGLDQTPFSSLDENNAFNAVGMRRLAEVIADSKKQRAEIDADAEVSVRRAAMEATRRTLEIELEERRAQIAQQQEIESLSAAQIAEIARRKAEAERAAAEARIDMERLIQAAEIERERSLEIAEQDRQISVAAKSQEESRAEAQASTARAEAVKAAEAVETARELAAAERRKQVALLTARAEAEAAAARAAIAAESEKATAKDKAAARREASEADKAAKLAEAEVLRARIEAENARSEALIAMELDKARLEAMPRIVGEMVKPAEKIKAINVHHVSGSAFERTGGTSAGGEKSAVNQAIESIMDMAVQMPVLKRIGESIGMDVDDVVSGASSKGKDRE
jgi:uncharacterized membrane protein YqiK